MRGDRELRKAIFEFLGILAGALAFAASIAFQADVDARVAWALVVAAVLCFSVGVGIALLGVLALAPREAVRFMAMLLAVTASLIAGAYFGSLVASSSEAGESARLAAKISALFDRLVVRRDADLRRLATAPGAAEQSAIASELSGAFARRAEVLRLVSGRRHDRRKARRLAGCLESVADAYRSLASAAGDPNGSQAALDRARRRVSRAERALTGCALGLSGDGYRVTTSLHSVT